MIEPPRDQGIEGEVNNHVFPIGAMNGSDGWWQTRASAGSICRIYKCGLLRWQWLRSWYAVAMLFQPYWWLSRTWLLSTCTGVWCVTGGHCVESVLIPMLFFKILWDPKSTAEVQKWKLSGGASWQGLTFGTLGCPPKVKPLCKGV